VNEDMLEEVDIILSSFLNGFPLLHTPLPVSYLCTLLSVVGRARGSWRHFLGAENCAVWLAGLPGLVLMLFFYDGIAARVIIVPCCIAVRYPGSGFICPGRFLWISLRVIGDGRVQGTALKMLKDGGIDGDLQVLR
jgi:hypothetical protein